MFVHKQAKGLEREVTCSRLDQDPKPRVRGIPFALYNHQSVHQPAVAAVLDVRMNIKFLVNV